jgi:hypothetical protein
MSADPATIRYLSSVLLFLVLAAWLSLHPESAAIILKAKALWDAVKPIRK